MIFLAKIKIYKHFVLRYCQLIKFSLYLRYIIDAFATIIVLTFFAFRVKRIIINYFWQIESF